MKKVQKSEEFILYRGTASPKNDEKRHEARRLGVVRGIGSWAVVSGSACITLLFLKLFFTCCYPSSRTDVTCRHRKQHPMIQTETEKRK